MKDKSTMNKIMEYMALEGPIDQFDLAEGRYLVEEMSLYVEKNDERDLTRKIIQLLDNPALRTRMCRFGRNRVENELEWKYVAPKLLAVYDMVFALGQYSRTGQ